MINKLKSDIENSNVNTEKKRSNSQRKYQKAPDIITQVKPNNFVQPFNPHQSAFTPTNRSIKLNSNKLLLPPKTSENPKKKTLILDLDETLVHSSFTPFQKNDIVLNVDLEGVMYNIYVLIRPDAELFIKSVAKFFELVIFTASISKYACPLLDILDKDKNIKYRLYRDHCTFINGIYIKDLKRCNRSLKDLIIVDNSPIAYTFDSENGLPIKTWVEDPNDRELMKLVPILEFLSKTKDVRVYIEQFVYNNKILYEEALEFIKMKEIMDKKNENNNLSNKENDKYLHNIKLLDKYNLEQSSNEKEAEEKDESIKEEEDIKINTQIKNSNLKKCKKLNSEIEDKKNDELKLNLNKDNISNTNIQNGFFDKGYNTAKNSYKICNNIKFSNNINIQENMTNINNINSNEETNVNTNKKNSGKQNCKQSKKNIFRFKAIDQQQNNNNNNKYGLNNIIFSNKFDPSLPLTLILSNISKNLLTPKASSQDKNTSKNNSKNKLKNANLNNIQPVLLKDISSGKTTVNKKIKYVNLLGKLKGNSKTNSSVNNINNIKNNKSKKIKMNYSMKNMNSAKPYNLRVYSSISNIQGYTQVNNNLIKDKNTTSHRVTKSKSTDNFLLYSTKIKHPKTPKEKYKQKIIMQNKKVINFTKDIKNRNNNSREGKGVFNKQKNKI